MLGPWSHGGTNSDYILYTSLPINVFHDLSTEYYFFLNCTAMSLVWYGEYDSLQCEGGEPMMTSTPQVEGSDSPQDGLFVQSEAGTCICACKCLHAFICCMPFIHAH